MEQRQTAPAQDMERAVVDLETFERVWRRVMPNQDMSPIQVGAPTGPGTGAERQAERIPAPAQLQNQDQGAAPAAQIQSSAQLQPQSQVPAPAEQAAGQVRQLEELMEGAWMGHRIYLELARRARGSGARTLNALAAEQRRTAQRLAACWFLLTGACYHFSSPPIPRVCPWPQRCGNSSCRSRSGDGYASGRAAEGDSTACGGLYDTLDGQAEHRMEAIRCLLEQMQPLPSGG